jgi:hypothetical protein
MCIHESPLYPEGVIHHSPGSIAQRAHPGLWRLDLINPERVVHRLREGRCRTPSGFIVSAVGHPGCATCGRDPGL